MILLLINRRKILEQFELQLIFFPHHSSTCYQGMALSMFLQHRRTLERIQRPWFLHLVSAWLQNNNRKSIASSLFFFSPSLLSFAHQITSLLTLHALSSPLKSETIFWIRYYTAVPQEAINAILPNIIHPKKITEVYNFLLYRNYW